MHTKWFQTPPCLCTKQRGEQNSRLCVMTERDYQCKVHCRYIDRQGVWKQRQPWKGTIFRETLDHKKSGNGFLAVQIREC